MQYSTTVTQKRQVTIPVRLRKKLGITRGKRIHFYAREENNQELILRPEKDFRELRGAFKSEKRYSKNAARKAIIKDVISWEV